MPEGASTLGTVDGATIVFHTSLSDRYCDHVTDGLFDYFLRGFFLASVPILHKYRTQLEAADSERNIQSNAMKI
jgi:hypothetical protein